MFKYCVGKDREIVPDLPITYQLHTHIEFINKFDMIQCKGHRKEPTREELDARGEYMVQNGLIWVRDGTWCYNAQNRVDAHQQLEVYVSQRLPLHIGIVQPLVEHIHKRDIMSICDSSVSYGINCKHHETRHQKNVISERYKCQTCGKMSTYNPGFVGRHSDDIIGALEDVTMGKSSAQATQSMIQTGQAPDPATVWRWTRSFGSLLKMTRLIACRTGYE